MTNLFGWCLDSRHLLCRTHVGELSCGCVCHGDAAADARQADFEGQVSDAAFETSRVAS